MRSTRSCRAPSAFAKTRSPSPIGASCTSPWRPPRKRAFTSFPRSLSNALNGTVTELAAALARRELSSVELTRACLERIARLNGALNAFITVDEERALADARRADERLAHGEGGPLTGIPVAHKDILCTRGML